MCIVSFNSWKNNEVDTVLYLPVQVHKLLSDKIWGSKTSLFSSKTNTNARHSLLRKNTVLSGIAEM